MKKLRLGHHPECSCFNHAASEEVTCDCDHEQLVATLSILLDWHGRTSRMDPSWKDWVAWGWARDLLSDSGQDSSS